MQNCKLQLSFLVIILCSLFIIISGCDADDSVIPDPIEPEEIIEEEEKEEEKFVKIEKPLVITIEADPGKGFYWDYFLFIPRMSILEDHSIYLLVSPNNSGTSSDDLEFHYQNAYKQASTSWKNMVARNLKVPLLVPTFPRPRSQWWIYTQALNRDSMLVKDGPLHRIDLQLIAMIKDAKNQLTEMGLNIEEKILMTGFSACGAFTNRFIVLHPHMVRAAAFGGLISVLIFPVSELKEEKLEYPIGIADIKDITGEEFNYEEYIQINQYIYHGSNDTHGKNDPTNYRDSLSQKQAEQIWRLFGRNINNRWENSKKVYEENKILVEFVTYEGQGHGVYWETIEDITTFFKIIIEK